MPPPGRKHDWLREVFSPSLFLFAALALASGLLTYVMVGAEAVIAALAADYELILRILPRIGAAVLVFGFVRVLLPPERVSQWVGTGSGLRGLAIATVAGMVTPGGPAAMFPMAAALGLAGADRGTLVAYTLGWALLGVQRMMIWEIPLLGSDFALFRFGLVAPLPLIGGMIARRLPIDPRPSLPAK